VFGSHASTNRLTIAKRIAAQLFRVNYFGGHLNKEFMELARIEIRKTIHTPVKILKMMDLKGGKSILLVWGSCVKSTLKASSASVTLHPSIQSGAQAHCKGCQAPWPKQGMPLEACRWGVCRICFERCDHNDACCIWPCNNRSKT
jgi:hypothetical protein